MKLLCQRLISGVWKTRAVQRRSIGDRWDVTNAEQIQFVPWKAHEEDEKADGDVLVAVKLTEEEVAEQLKEADFDLSDTAVPRRFYVITKLLKEHGFSAKCEGCRAVLENKPKQTHSEECRRRILEAIGKHDPRLVAQRQRFDSYLDKAAAKEDFQELEKLEREKKRMRPEETVPDVPTDAGASSSSGSKSSGSKEAQEKR